MSIVFGSEIQDEVADTLEELKLKKQPEELEDPLYTAYWDGTAPYHCFGSWTLYCNGMIVANGDSIPFQHAPANTEGEFSRFHFTDDWRVESCTFSDGMPYEVWAEEYKDFLSSVAQEKYWKSIYDSFKAEDWRYGGCGGCFSVICDECM